MQSALEGYRERYDFDLKVIDIDAEADLNCDTTADIDKHLLTRYDDLVPVLAQVMPSGEICEVCHHFLDVEALETILSATTEYRPNNGSAQ